MSMRCATTLLAAALALPEVSCWMAGSTCVRVPVSAPSLTTRSASPLLCAEPASGAAAAAEAPSSLSAPPPSFLDLIEQASEATITAVKEGSNLLEIEFPPVPLSRLEDSAISAYDLLSANLQLSLELSKKLAASGALGEGKSVAITLPDAAERVRASEYLGDDNPAANVKLWALSGGDTEPSPFGFLTSLIKSVGDTQAAEWAGAYILVGVSCQELPQIRRLAELAPNVPIIAFNLKLDTLRGDLGLPGFPSKDVHHEFLCKMKAVYYMRPRSYSLSLSRPPFLLSYQGVLFRKYPEGFQTLLDRGQGSYRQVAVDEKRPNLGGFKAKLTEALKLSDEAASSAISQVGNKQSTWWEDDKDGRDISKEWRD
tara:strand:+ start:454 stop:1566 length:1113 start_codon:yes stop_codon:yes gene_type:complete